MTEPRTAREALIAELLGEVDTLLQRIERFAPELDVAQERLGTATAGMVDASERYRLTIQALTDQAQTSAVQYLVRRTNEISERSLQEQTEAMKAAARVAFDGEAASRLRQLTTSLDRALDRAERSRWHPWLSHAATALVASGVTATVLLTVLGK